VVGEGRVAGVEVSAQAAVALRLASKSASFFFLSALMAMSAQKQQVTKGQRHAVDNNEQVK